MRKPVEPANDCVGPVAQIVPARAKRRRHSRTRFGEVLGKLEIRAGSGQHRIQRDVGKLDDGVLFAFRERPQQEHVGWDRWCYRLPDRAYDGEYAVGHFDRQRVANMPRRRDIGRMGTADEDA